MARTVDLMSAMVLAPDDGIGVVVRSNTGGLDNRGASDPQATALLRRLLGLPDLAIRADIAVRPENWSELCGPDPGPVTNLFVRASMGAGAEVAVHDGHLMLDPLARSRRCDTLCACIRTIATTHTCSGSSSPSSE